MSESNGSTHEQTAIVDQFGFRAGGRTYRPGDRAPIRYTSRLEQPRQSRDPGATFGDLPPNAGRFIIPHIQTFQGRVSTLARSYKQHDQAIRHSVTNAHAMINDPMIFGPLTARQLMVALLKWSIEPEDDKDPTLQEIARQLTILVRKTPYFTNYLRTMQEAVWYGRYAIQNKFARKRDRRTGRIQYWVDDWKPISGDKLYFRFDDGSGKYDPNQVGVKISPTHVQKDVWTGHPDLEFAHEGAVLFLQGWQRKRLTLHRHLIRDGEYEDPLSGSMIHGVGLRNFLYWAWFQKQETLGQLVEVVERTGMGFTIYYYPDGNDQAKKEMTARAEDAPHKNQIILPSVPDDPNAYGIQQIPPNTQGIAALQGLIDDYFGNWILRAILGQTLSQKSDATGLGSGNADLQHDSLKQIVKFDAVNAEESVTREFVRPLQCLNFPRYRSANFFFRLHTDSSIPQEELMAIESLWNMGGKIKVSDVYDKIGISEPKNDEEALFNPQVRQAIDSAGMDPSMLGGGIENPMGGPDPMGDVEQPPGAMDITLPGDEMQYSESPTNRKRKIFGPILNKKARDNWDAIDWKNSKTKADRVDQAARETDTNPSDAQVEAENYKKGKFAWNGLTIAIENPKGSTRSGKGWEVEMTAHYGQVYGNTGSDGDLVDVFVGPNPDSDYVCIIDQCTESGRFDEHKVVIGTSSMKEARDLYASNYSPGWKVGPCTGMTATQFRNWLDKGDTTKPVARQFRANRYQSRNPIARTVEYVRARNAKPKRYQAKGPFHAPKGGATINGKHYPGGQWIPKEALAGASKQELDELQASEPHSVESAGDLSALPEGARIDGSYGHSWQHQGEGQWSYVGKGGKRPDASSEEVFNSLEDRDRKMVGEHADLKDAARGQRAKRPKDDAPDKAPSAQAGQSELKPSIALKELPEGAKIGMWQKQDGFWHHGRSKAIKSDANLAQELDGDTQSYAVAIAQRQRDRQAEQQRAEDELKQNDTAQAPEQAEEPRPAEPDSLTGDDTGRSSEGQGSPSGNDTDAFDGFIAMGEDDTIQPAKSQDEEPVPVEWQDIPEQAESREEVTETPADTGEGQSTPTGQPARETPDEKPYLDAPARSTVTDREGARWVKEEHKDLPGGFWTIHPEDAGKVGSDGTPIDQSARTSGQMARSADHDSLEHAGTPEGDQTSKQKNSQLWAEHGDSLKDLAHTMGIESFDGHMQQRVQNFVVQQARETGYDPQGDSQTAKAIDAAQHLSKNLHHYDGIVDYARSLGFKGNARMLGSKFRQSGQAIIRMANETGANVNPMHPPSKQLGQALNHLQQSHADEQGQGGFQGMLDQIASLVGGRKNLFILAGMLFATYAAYRLLDKMSR